MVRSLLMLVTLVACILPPLAFAASFCVSTSAELRQALSLVDDNGEDDVIQLRQETFSTFVGASGFIRFHLDVKDAKSVSISGGWDGEGSTCEFQEMNPVLTTLTGELESIVLDLGLSGGNPLIALSNLRIHEGFNDASGGVGAGIVVYGFTGAPGIDLHLDRVIVEGNVRQGGSGGGIGFLGHNLRIKNSVFVGNVANEFPALHATVAGEGSALINVNVVGNTATGLGGNRGLAITGSNYAIANSVIWGNHGSSMDVSDIHGSAAMSAFNNNIENFSGTPNEQSANNISVDPQWRDSTRMQPSYHSPLRNAGLPLPPAAVGLLDINGDTRIQDGTVDIGAAESDAIFEDAMGD